GGLGYPQFQGFGQQSQFGPPVFGQQGQFGTPFLAQQGQFGTPFFAQHGQQGFGGGGGLGYPQLGGITPHGLFGHLPAQYGWPVGPLLGGWPGHSPFAGQLGMGFGQPQLGRIPLELALATMCASAFAPHAFQQYGQQPFGQYGQQPFGGWPIHPQQLPGLAIPGIL